MRTLDYKTVKVDIHSKKTWEDIKVPEALIKNLTKEPLLYSKPSIIQSFAIPQIMGNKNQNFIFQSMNGSGKTAAFCVPAIMSVDITSDET